MVARKMPLRLQKYIKKTHNNTKAVKLEEYKKLSPPSLDNVSCYLQYDVEILANNKSCFIDVVYFANLYVNVKHGIQLIEIQLKELINTGLCEFSRLHIVLSVPGNLNQTNIKTSLLRLFSRQHEVLFHITSYNVHEYPGIQLVYSLSGVLNSPSHYILYFHAKGITRFRGTRDIVETRLHNTVIARWREVLHVFRDNPEINKIGSTFSNVGFIWWNYWWVRCSYIVQVESPIITPRRHYYEDWLCRVLIQSEQYQKNNDPYRQEVIFQYAVHRLNHTDCWSLSRKNSSSRTPSTPTEALHHL